MSLLKSIEPEMAIGGMKRIYDSFLDAVGMVPPPLLVSSASPALQALLATLMIYYKDHPTLSGKLIALIRYSISVIFELESCARFSERALRILGISEEQIRDLQSDPESSPLKGREKDLYDFVICAIRNPEAVSEKQISRLRELEWSDADIFDALNVASIMIGPGLIMRALKVQ
jgi:hypothetical protein